MGALLDPLGHTHPLDARNRVGRAGDADVHLDDAHVSYDHARLTWLGDTWALEDLTSRNGTTIDGAPVHGRVDLSAGAQIAFGGGAPWRLADAGPPRPWAVGPGGVLRRAQAGLLSLPDDDQPSRWLVRQGERWLLEGGAEIIEPAARSVVLVDDVPWRVRVPRLFTPTRDRGTPAPTLGVVIQHSPDEEHIEIHIERGGERASLAHRAHSFLLLHLARLRLADMADGRPDAECGWVLPEVLEADLRLTRAQLNMVVYRARRQLADKGPADCDDIVARRRGSGHLRLAPRRVTVGPLR